MSNICFTREANQQAIGGFKAWASDATHVYVSWQPSSNKSVCYSIYRTEDPGQSDPDRGYPDLNPVGEKTWGMTPARDTDIIKGHKYYYKMRTFQCVDGQPYYGPYSNVDYAYPR